MGRIVVTPQEILRLTPVTVGTGGTEFAGDASNGHYFLNDGRVILLARNTDGSNDHTVTIRQAVSYEGQSAGTVVHTITKNTTCAIFGPFPTEIYNQRDGSASVFVDTDSSSVKLTALIVNVAK